MNLFSETTFGALQTDINKIIKPGNKLNGWREFEKHAEVPAG
jgi:hypothetical protein